MKVSIPKPCHENWNDMTPGEQGAFCKVCSKVVIDFSKMSDDEIVNYFENRKGEKTCGRFRVSQVAPYQLTVSLAQVAQQKSFKKIFAASLFIFFSSLFVCKSDTGDTFTFNKIQYDTASAVLSTNMPYTDTALAVPGNETIAATDSHTTVTEPIVMGGISVPVPILVPDTLLPAPDTISPAPSTMLLGEVSPVVEETFIMGKTKCAPPPPTPKDKKPSKRHKRGNPHVLGLIYF